MKRKLTFFYKHYTPSGKIRGRQVASHLGAKRNPQNGYENDICVYVKQFPPEDFPEHSYIDIVDGRRLVNWAFSHPKMGVIAISKTAQTYLRKRLKRDDVYLIPEHHCNFKNIVCTSKNVTTVGYMGSRTGSNFPDDIKERFAEVGLEFKYFTRYKTRHDVVRFYNSIDIQVMHQYIRRSVVIKLKNPLKLANAGSFGIPSVAYPEINFVDEFKNCFIEAETIDDMILQCKKLRESKDLYNDIANKALLRSKEYHIDKILPLYKSLK